MATSTAGLLHRLPTFAWLAGLAFAGGALLGSYDFGGSDTSNSVAATAAQKPSPVASVPASVPATVTPTPSPVVSDTPKPTPTATPVPAAPRRFTAPPAQPTTSAVQGRITALVKLQRSRLGTVVADDRGHTAYRYDRDDRQPTQSHCYGRCARTWLPLLVDDNTLAAANLDIKRFGLIARTDGGRQLTYQGWPLYVYKGDRQPGSVKGNDGAYGTWHAALH